MAQSEKVILEVYDAPTFSLSTPIHVKAGVVGDTVSWVVTASAVGGWTGSVTLELVDAPSGAEVTYDPNPATIADGESVTISVDTTACSEAVTRMTVQEAS